MQIHIRKLGLMETLKVEKKSQNIDFDFERQTLISFIFKCDLI